VPESLIPAPARTISEPLTSDSEATSILPATEPERPTVKEQAEHPKSKTPALESLSTKLLVKIERLHQLEDLIVTPVEMRAGASTESHEAFVNPTFVNDFYARGVESTGQDTQAEAHNEEVASSSLSLSAVEKVDHVDSMCAEEQEFNRPLKIDTTQLIVISMPKQLSVEPRSTDNSTQTEDSLDEMLYSIRCVDIPISPFDSLTGETQDRYMLEISRLKTSSSRFRICLGAIKSVLDPSDPDYEYQKACYLEMVSQLKQSIANLSDAQLYVARSLSSEIASRENELRVEKHRLKKEIVLLKNGLNDASKYQQHEEMQQTLKVYHDRYNDLRTVGRILDIDVLRNEKKRLQKLLVAFKNELPSDHESAKIYYRRYKHLKVLLQ
jgi:hypothetical protein